MMNYVETVFSSPPPLPPPPPPVWAILVISIIVMPRLFNNHNTISFPGNSRRILWRVIIANTFNTVVFVCEAIDQIGYCLEYVKCSRGTRIDRHTEYVINNTKKIDS